MTDSFDWHSGTITRSTPITASYRRPFMAWLKDGKPKTMGDAVEEWKRRAAGGS